MKRIIPSICQILIFAGAILLLGACSSHKHSVRRPPRNHAEELKIEREIEKEAEKRMNADEKRVIEEAFEWLDTPYAFGREDKGKATDCSGMVMRVFEKAIGCKLPRNSAKQAEFCETIDAKNVKAGDLVFFITNSGSKINHVGIMIDAVQFIHASSKGVMVSSMESYYYKTHFKKYGRVPCLKH